MQGVTPPEACRRVSLEIDFSGSARRSDLGLGRRSRGFSRSGNTNPREEKVGNSRDIRDARGRHRGGSHWKSTSQA